jgi:pimeloyl-ACP methyl ester carboxylesterase
VRWFGCFVTNHPIDPGSANPLCHQTVAPVADGPTPKVSAIRLKGRLIASGQKVTVTGYSLGGHLATAFNIMHGEDVDRVVTFNGAGEFVMSFRSTEFADDAVRDN